MKAHHGLCVALGLVFFGSYAQAQTLTLANPGTDDRLASITNLSIASVNYDVTFTHGIAFSGLPGTPITFSTSATAVVAIDAIRTFINGTLTAFGITNTESIAVPYTPTVNYAFSTRSPSSPYNFPTSVVSGASQTPGFPINADQAYATFSPSSASVPEPGAFALAAMVAGVIGYRRRRQKLVVVETAV